MRGGFICKLFLAVLHQKCTVPENIDTYPMEILKAGDGGWGVSKAKICKGKYEAKLEFPKGGGGGMGGMDIFWSGIVQISELRDLVKLFAYHPGWSFHIKRTSAHNVVMFPTSIFPAIWCIRQIPTKP